MPVAVKIQKPNLPFEGYQVDIENHQKAASHLTRAVKHHYDAAHFYDAGEHGKAASSAHLANGHLSLAGVAQKDTRSQTKHHDLADSRPKDSELSERQRILNAHQEVITYLEKAVKYHQEAASRCANGDQEKATEFTIAAHAYQDFAKKAQREWQMYFGK